MTTPGTADTQEPFPFMKLPPEIRLMIYEFGIHNSMQAAKYEVSGPMSGYIMPPVYLGALELVHTSSSIRKESRDAMHAIAYRHWKVVYPAAYKPTQDPVLLYEAFRVQHVWEALAEPPSFGKFYS